MSNFRLLSQILRGEWLIDSRFADGYLPIVADLIEGKPSAFLQGKKSTANSTHAYIKDGNSFIRVDDENELMPGAVVAMGISGPVMKDDFCGDVGTSTLRNHLRKAVTNKNVSAILLKMETGGGAVDGTFELADDIRNASRIKPIIGYVDGLSASAGYAIQSGCTKIFTSHKTAEVGSIGVAATIMDYSEKLKALGVKEHYINASTNPDKNKAFMDARKGDYKGYQEKLDEIHQIFMDTVKAGRGSKINLEVENVFTGKTYLSEQAYQYGLIDGICSFEDALSEAYELGTYKTL
jgi:protease IV